MDALKAVLEEIRSGRTSFKPVSRDEKDMWDFQPIAKLLAYANSEGLLESFIPHKECDSPHGWYDLVLVRGGLSYKGEMFLSEPHAETEEAKLEDIVQLKPSIYGIGIDLKALWKRWKTRSS